VTDNLAVLLDRLLADGAEPILRSIVGNAVPRTGERNRYQIAASGQFRGAIAADLLAFAQTQKFDATMVIIEEDTHRVLYFHGGALVGTDSNVLFERLGRVLFKGGVIDKKDANALVDCEERLGLERAIQLVPGEAAYWGLERRAWDVGAGLYFMGHAHFLIVDGRPDLGKVPLLGIDPVQLAMEGLRRYDEWRNGPSKTTRESEHPAPKAPSRTTLVAPDTRPPAPETPAAPRPRTPEDEADEIMRKLLGE
jgi:hypothetical protein